ncbi:MAG: hypothetical protein AAF676_06815, partial [Pseudomonadota bacterium]
ARAEAAAARLELLIAASRGRESLAETTSRAPAPRRSEAEEGFVAAARRAVRPPPEAATRSPASGPAPSLTPSPAPDSARTEAPRRREPNETAVLRATIERIARGGRPAAEGA